MKPTDGSRGLIVPATEGSTILVFEVVRPFVCDGCGARVYLTVKDPLPPGWLPVLERPRNARWTTDWAAEVTRYLCPKCAPDLTRPVALSTDGGK